MSLNKTGSSRNLRPNGRVGEDESKGRRDLILTKKEKKSYVRLSLSDVKCHQLVPVVRSNICFVRGIINSDGIS